LIVFCQLRLNFHHIIIINFQRLHFTQADIFNAPSNLHHLSTYLYKLYSCHGRVRWSCFSVSLFHDTYHVCKIYF
jgi:hypothetical protein